MNFLDLPECMMLEIFEYLTYDEVSKYRLVCRRINQVCQQVLNSGFNKAVREHSTIFKRIKALLPRRESERRNHSLARHADILTSIETRISMLSMTYSKYMDLNLCCFIPGRVLDEIFRILNLVAKTRKTLRPHEVLQELRDISSMAIEHFDEKIANILKPHVDSSTSSRSSSSNSGENRRMSSSSGLGSISFSVSPGVSSSWNSSSVSSIGSTCGTNCTNSGCISQCCESIRQRMNTLINMRRQANLLTQWNAGDIQLPLSGMLKECSAPKSTGNETVKKCEEPGGCPEARATMAKFIKLEEEFKNGVEKFKKLETEYKNGVIKMNRMQHVQIHQARRLQQTLSTVNVMNTQIVELKKRLEDLDAKNREISANVKQINPGGEQVTPAVAPLTSPVVPADHLAEDTTMNCGTDINDGVSGSSNAKKQCCDSISQISRKRKAESD